VIKYKRRKVNLLYVGFDSSIGITKTSVGGTRLDKIKNATLFFDGHSIDTMARNGNFCRDTKKKKRP
jgi:hypothetical protein